jgi:hypothetical protein
MMVNGSVNIQATAMRDTILYCNPAPDTTMVPAIPEVTICVVLTGRPLKPAVPISAAETSSAEAP